MVFSGLPDRLHNGLEYPVQLPAFEGPLDLLLYLLRRDEVDIYDIPIASITAQYLSILRQLEGSSVELAGEFFVMAATLMLIKSRMLLPKEQRSLDEVEDNEEGSDPRWALVEQLLEYKKYKEAAEKIAFCMESQSGLLPRRVSPTALLKERPLNPIESSQLASIFSNALLRLRDRITLGSVHADSITVADRIAWVLTYLSKKPAFIFNELWEGPAPRAVVSTTFLAILELTRLKELAVVQAEPFADIYISAISSQPSEF